MATFLNAILTQTFYYAVVMVFAFLGVGVLQKGFFWKYVKVRLSFGKLVLVKIRGRLRDYYAVGHVEGSFLIFNKMKGDDGKKIRLTIPPGTDCFYRCLSVTWVDVDEQTKGICKVNYSAVPGFNAEEFSNLYERALTKPQELPTQEKIMLAIVVGVGILMLLMLILVYKDYSLTHQLAVAKGLVAPGGFL